MKNPINDMNKEYSSEKQFTNGQDRAVKLFDMQADSIRNIRTTDGYIAIKQFLQTEKDNAITRLMSTTKADLPEVRALLVVTSKLLEFLANREKDLQKLAG